MFIFSKILYSKTYWFMNVLRAERNDIIGGFWLCFPSSLVAVQKIALIIPFYHKRLILPFYMNFVNESHGNALWPIFGMMWFLFVCNTPDINLVPIMSKKIIFAVVFYVGVLLLHTRLFSSSFSVEQINRIYWRKAVRYSPNSLDF